MLYIPCRTFFVFYIKFVIEMFDQLYRFNNWCVMCSGVHEVRRVKRNMLVEALAKELPSGTIRYSSKVVSIEESGFYKLVHLADGTTFKTKVKFISSSKREKRKEKKRKNH